MPKQQINRKKKRTRTEEREERTPPFHLHLLKWKAVAVGYFPHMQVRYLPPKLRTKLYREVKRLPEESDRNVHSRWPKIGLAIKTDEANGMAKAMRPCQHNTGQYSNRKSYFEHISSLVRFNTLQYWLPAAKREYITLQGRFSLVYRLWGYRPSSSSRPQIEKEVMEKKNSPPHYSPSDLPL